MKFIPFLLLFLFFKISAAQDLVILHTNDLHSHLNGFSPESEYTPLTNNDDQTLGGFARIGGFIQQEKAKYADQLLVCDAGDFLMGTLFQTIEPLQGFQLHLMKEMGYDYVAIGNHEFDFGVHKLVQIINNNKTQGEIPQLLLTNRLKGNAKKIIDFNELYTDGTILPYDLIEKNGKTIGIFSLMGVDAEESIPLEYALHFENVKKTARKTAKYLKKQGADLVIALSHTGVHKTRNDEWKGEDYQLGKAIDDIDLIIGGHTHTQLNKALQAGNTMIVQTGEFGKNIGRIEVNFDATGKPLFQYELIPMDDEIQASAEIQARIDTQVEFIEEDILDDFPMNYNELVFETAFDVTKDDYKPLESNLGPLVADAIYHSVNNVDTDGLDVALVASGVIRNNIMKGQTGKQKIADVFNVMPLGRGNDLIPGSPIGKIYATGNELKKVLELTMAVAPKHTSFFLYFSGMKVSYDPHKRIFKKISAIQVGNEEKGYTDVDLSKKNTKLYGVAANVYMIGFIEMLKKMSKGIVDVVPKDKDGNPITTLQSLIDVNPNKEGLQETKEWYVLYKYLNSFEDVNQNSIPDLPEYYKTKRNQLEVIN